MARDAIEAVREAEERAKSILSEANQTSKDLKNEAELLANQEYGRIIAEAESKAKDLKDKSIKEGEALSKPIVEKGLMDAKALLAMKDEELNPAVNIIIERIVNANGNS